METTTEHAGSLNYPRHATALKHVHRRLSELSVTAIVPLQPLSVAFGIADALAVHFVSVGSDS